MPVSASKAKPKLSIRELALQKREKEMAVQEHRVYRAERPPLEVADMMSSALQMQMQKEAEERFVPVARPAPPPPPPPPAASSFSVARAEAHAPQCV
jgi:hypothetical protein